MSPARRAKHNDQGTSASALSCCCALSAGAYCVVSDTQAQLLNMVLESALLWSGAAVLALYLARRATTAKWPRRILSVLFGIALYQFACALWTFIVPISGSVRDAETGKPIAGTPVYSKWVGLAPSWENWCWATQRTLSDADGEFTFRFPPASTMLPVFQRGAHASIPGRVMQSDSNYWLLPVISAFPMNRFGPEQPIAVGAPAADCSTKRTLIRGGVVDTYRDHPDAYRDLYFDACVALKPATRTDRHFQALTTAWAHEYELTLPLPITGWRDPMLKVVQAPGTRLHEIMRGFSYGCGHAPGLCARVIDESLAQELCVLVAPRSDFRSQAKP